MFLIQIEPTTVAPHLALPAGCDTYNVLDNPERKTAYATVKKQENTDKAKDGPSVSPDWHGNNQYRISPFKIEMAENVEKRYK